MNRVAGFGLALMFFGSTLSAADLKVGDAAPDFELQGTDGKSHRLSDLKGKAVVLAWFPKAFTGGWTAECKSLRESGDAIRAFAVNYFAASCDPIETNKEFAESLELDYALLSDPGKNVAKSYGVVTPERELPHRWTFYIGADGKILHIDKDVKTASAGADIAARLKQLGVAAASE